jgi:hypothetical protein
MEMLAESLRRRGCVVETVPLAPDPVLPAARFDSPVPATVGRAGDTWDLLTHYTREPDGAWPGESRRDYLNWLVAGPIDSRRDAHDALRRILDTGLVLGSGRLMPGRVKMVSFTARPPCEMGGLIRWRPGLRRWAFRPYGLAVPREALDAMGARPVQYLPDRMLRTLALQEREFAQKHQPPATDWEGEREWRLRGDFRLSDLPREALRALVPTREEARRIEEETGITARAICE